MTTILQLAKGFSPQNYYTKCVWRIIEMDLWGKFMIEGQRVLSFQSFVAFPVKIN